MIDIQIINEDVLDGLAMLEDESVNCVVTSPPYWGLRDYGVDGQIGLEDTPEAFAGRLASVFRDVRRVLKSDGTLWLNLGDTYAGGGNGARDPERWPKQSRNDHRVKHHHRRPAPPIKQKDLVGIPWLVAFALRADGWYLRQDIIWHKPNVMPESVKDRCTKSHEYIFLMTKSSRYQYNADAIKEPCSEESIKRSKRKHRPNKKRVAQQTQNPSSLDRGNGPLKMTKMRNKRSVWRIPNKPFAKAHFATFPEALAEPCIKAGCPEGGIVLDPFGGSGTTAVAAAKLNRNAILIELNPEYAQLAADRIANEFPAEG